MCRAHLASLSLEAVLTCTGLPPAAGLPLMHLLQLGRALPCEQAAVLACPARRAFFSFLYLKKN